MLHTYRGWCLPHEILKQIFQNLVKKDHKTCLLVCKSWNSVAQEYFSHDISIEVNESWLDILQNDIQFFGEKVKAIGLKNCEYRSIDKNNEPNWRRVLSLCPNLTSVYFMNYCNIISFLKSLQDPNIRLNNLQKIKVEEMTTDFFDIRDVFLQVNIHYRRTITSLKLCASLEDHISVEYGGLDKFILQFPRLKILKVHGKAMFRSKYDNQESTVELKHLLEGAPQLEEVNLKYFHRITSDWNKNIVRLVKNTSLTRLKIVTKETSIRTLRYIVTTLKQVKVLRLNVDIVTFDQDISEDKPATILNDLKAYTSEMEKWCVIYKYGNQDYKLYFDAKK